MDQSKIQASNPYGDIAASAVSFEFSVMPDNPMQAAINASPPSSLPN